MATISEAEHYELHFTSQRRAQQLEALRKGEQPTNLQSKEAAYVRYMYLLSQPTPRYHEEHVVLSYIPPSYPPCTTPLAALKPLTIRDLRLEIHHRGHFIVLRCMTPPKRELGTLETLAEDAKGDVMLIDMFHQEPEEMRKASDVVGVGKVVLVREPWFRVLGTDGYRIRVDHVSDIEFLEDDDERVPAAWKRTLVGSETAAAVKAKGNAAVGKKDYRKAISEYSRALRLSTDAEETEIIKRNRALALLNVKQYDAALEDTGFPNLNSSSSEKALFRAAQSLYHLGRFGECCEVLHKLQKGYPDNQQAVELLTRGKKRHLEQTNGEYDFKELHAELKKSKVPVMDAATYIGPVEIRNTANKGRGLFTTRAVKAGELLLCEKAFDFFHSTEDGSQGPKHFRINLETDKMFPGNQIDLVTTMINKLARNPSFAKDLTALFHGSYQGTDVVMVDGKPVIDTFLIERIMAVNVFGCVTSTLDNYKLKQDTGHRVDSGPMSDSSTGGVWIKASYINHSCFSTANRSFIGDMMIVRASKDLPKGAEVTMWYLFNKGDPVQFKSHLKSWGFECSCAICDETKLLTPAAAAQRQQLAQDILGLCMELDMAEIEKMISALDNAYRRPAIKVPRVALWPAQLFTVVYYDSKERPAAVVRSVIKFLTMMSFVVEPSPFRIVKWGLVIDDVIGTLGYARKAFAQLGQYSNAERVEVYARLAYKIVLGEDSSFDETHRGK